MNLGFFTKRGKQASKTCCLSLYIFYFSVVLPEKFTMIKVMIFMIKKKIYTWIWCFKKQHSIIKPTPHYVKNKKEVGRVYHKTVYKIAYHSFYCSFSWRASFSFGGFFGGSFLCTSNSFFCFLKKAVIEHVLKEKAFTQYGKNKFT